MKIINCYLVTILLLSLTACSKSKKESGDRIVFHSDGLGVITSSANQTLKTMSVLYGNEEAYNAALLANGLHVSGEVFRFVTWKYDENPLWLGSQINGELLSVEKIEMTSLPDKSTGIDYQIEKGTPTSVNGVELDRQQRISYILGHRPSVLP